MTYGTMRPEEIQDLRDQITQAEADAESLSRECSDLRAQLARKSQLANRLAFVVLHFWRSRDYWHQRFRWCASYSGRLQMERERERED